jgi:sugar (pentulose or hexulose) kinase
MPTAIALDTMLVRSVTAYSAKVREAVLAQHPGASVCSPLGVWLLLCACLRAAEDPEREELAAVVGCSQSEASVLLDAFLESVPSVIQVALALWARDEVLTDQLTAWMVALPAAIDRGAIPTQQDANTWAESNTFG